MDTTFFRVVRFDSSDTFRREVESMTQKGFDLLMVVDTPGYEALEWMALVVKTDNPFTEGQVEKIEQLFYYNPLHLESVLNRGQVVTKYEVVKTALQQRSNSQL